MESRDENSLILVGGHERSGNHFLVNALRLNIKGAVFPFIRPTLPNLENLVLPHDRDVFDGFRKHLSGEYGQIRIFKTHMLPSEIEAALSLKGLLNEEEKELIGYVYHNARRLYITRDGRDVLVSLYHYMRDGGGIQVGMQGRLERMSFSEFLRMPNHHIHTVRSFQPYDENVVTFWRRHMEEWTSLPDVILTSYEELHDNFEGTISKLAGQLGVEAFLVDPIQQASMRRSQKYPLKARIAIKLGLQNRLPSLFKDISVVPRKGIIGDWENHFSQADQDFFMEFAGERSTTP